MATLATPPQGAIGTPRERASPCSNPSCLPGDGLCTSPFSLQCGPFPRPLLDRSWPPGLAPSWLTASPLWSWPPRCSSLPVTASSFPSHLRLTLLPLRPWTVPTEAARGRSWSVHLLSAYLLPRVDNLSPTGTSSRPAGPSLLEQQPHWGPSRFLPRSLFPTTQGTGSWSCPLCKHSLPVSGASTTAWPSAPMPVPAPTCLPNSMLTPTVSQMARNYRRAL